MCCGGGGDWESKLSTCLHRPTSSHRPTQPLTCHSFSTVKPLAPRNLTVQADISHTWLLTWSNPYPSENLLNSELSYLVNISNENDPTDVSGHPRGFPMTAWDSGGWRLRLWGVRWESNPHLDVAGRGSVREPVSPPLQAPDSQCADREFIFRHGSSSVKEELWTTSVSQGWGTCDFRRYLYAHLNDWISGRDGHSLLKLTVWQSLLSWAFFFLRRFIYLFIWYLN